MRTSSGYDQSGDAYDKGAGAGGAVNSVTGNLVDNTDPANPVVDAPTVPRVVYLSATTGNDANDGLSIATPWQTTTRASIWLEANFGSPVALVFLSPGTYTFLNVGLGGSSLLLTSEVGANIVINECTYGAADYLRVNTLGNFTLLNQVSSIYALEVLCANFLHDSSNFPVSVASIRAGYSAGFFESTLSGSQWFVEAMTIGINVLNVGPNINAAFKALRNMGFQSSINLLGGSLSLSSPGVSRSNGVVLISAPSQANATQVYVDLGTIDTSTDLTPWGVFGANDGVSLSVSGYLGDDFYPVDAVNGNPAGNTTLRYSYSRGFAVKQSKGLTGFNAPGNCVVLYDVVNLGGSIVNAPEALFRGARIFDPVTVPLNFPPHANADGLYFYTYDGSAFQVSTTPFTFDQFLVMLAAQINGTRFGLRECHGHMDYLAHQEFHNVWGTYKLSAGGDFSGYVDGSNLAAEIKPDISSFTIHDEDLPTVITALNGDVEGYTTVRFLNAGDLSFTPAYETPIPVVENLVDNWPYWNEFTGGAWQQTLFGSGEYGKVFVMALPVTQDAHSQQFRLLFIQPQIVSNNLTTIRNVQPSQYNYGALTSLLPEAVIVGSIIYQYQPSGTPLLRLRIIECTKIFGNRIAQFGIAGSQGLTSVATDLETISGDGTLGDPIKLLAPAPYSSPFGATTGTVAISPNVFSVFTNPLGATITFQLAGAVISGRANEYHIRFTTGAVVTAITFDPAVTWNSAPVFAPSTTYEVSIVDGFGVWVEYV
jgi:hypothetical protein